RRAALEAEVSVSTVDLTCNSLTSVSERVLNGLFVDSDGASPSRRRSGRLCAREQSPEAEAPPAAVKRSITVRKIAPRKTQALCDSNKENLDRSSEIVRSSPAVAAVLSAIRPLSPSALPKEPEQDPVWPQKVRRSYSRLSAGDRSLESRRSHPAPSTSPNTRETLFGFERLWTPEVMRAAERSGLAPLGSLFNISAAEDSASNPPEIDPHIPGVCLGKKTARRRRVQQITKSELDVLAAEMNAEFEEAESFELFVE
uniref:Cell division cycle associated 5 n=1 Tax=Cyprinus carpio TaxID=7962 RepID=A0A8C1UNI6_CYPCA